jgi:hypothetical protein
MKKIFTLFFISISLLASAQAPTGGPADGKNSKNVGEVSQNNDDQKFNLISWSVVPDGIRVRNVPISSRIKVLDLIGKQILDIQNNSSELTLNLPHKGIYLLQIRQNQELKTFKVLF